MAKYLDLTGLTAYDTAIKAHIASLLSTGVKKQVVDSLPAVGDAADNVIYLIPAATSATGNVRDEYMLISGAFEKIGSTAVSLDGYVNDASVASGAGWNPFSGTSVLTGVSINGNELRFTSREIDVISDSDIEALFD